MPTNKPNIEVPNHTDKIDEILAIFADYLNPYDDADGFEEIQIGKLNKAKAQLRNYISEEIKAVINHKNDMTFSDKIPTFDNLEEYIAHVALIRKTLRTELLTEARNRGHNV